jgi:RNA polymerase-interacting CarD/CdnL/TRCF family regulator
MIQAKIVQGSLLYHAVHGLCCVKKLTRQKEIGKETLFYSLEPKSSNKSKVRFLVPEAAMEASGFHLLVSAAQAKGILKYLKHDGASTLVAGSEHEAAHFAREIISISHEDKTAKDQRTRKRVERSVHGLVGELAVSLEISLKEIAQMIRNSLEGGSKINPLVISALQNIGEGKNLTAS